MVHLYRYIILIISLCTTQLVSAYGLRFRGAASPIDERTSYDVFAHSCPSFKDYFDLEFNMALYSTESVGYVLRVKGADEGQIFNLFFDWLKSFPVEVVGTDNSPFFTVNHTR